MFKICRTCLKTIKGEYEYISTDIPAYNLDITSTCNKLQNCIPELDLTLVPGPVICTDCITALDVAYKFKEQCLEADENIRAYLEKPNCSYDLTKLLELVQENKEAKNVIIKTEHIESVIEQPVFESRPPCDDQNEDIKPFNNMKIKDEANNESYFQEVDQQDLNIQADENDYWTPHHFMDVENNFQCDICLLSFRRRQALIEHQDTHVFKCNFCGIVTKTKGGLVSHTKIHTDRQFRKLFPCTQCDRRFVSYAAAKRHIKKCHRPVYKCPTCNYSSTNSCHLKNHIKIHTEGGPFSCTKCDYRGSTMQHLQAHVTLHDNECHLCSFKTRYKINLLSHLFYCVRKNKPKPLLKAPANVVKKSQTPRSIKKQPKKQALPLINSSDLNAIQIDEAIVSREDPNDGHNSFKICHDDKSNFDLNKNGGRTA